MTDFILGVDPGLGGALALYNTQTPHQSKVWDMPLNGEGRLDGGELQDIIGSLSLLWNKPTLGVIERVHSRPRQAGAFNFGLSTGIVHGVFAANGIPFELVTPQEWKKAMGLTRGQDEEQADTKTRARALAAQLFPTMADQFKRVRDDGRAEALLLAVYYANRRK